MGSFDESNGISIIYVDDYVQLFKNSSAMSSKGCEILKAHFSFPLGKATALQLAHAVGKDNFQYVNNVYGKFAKKLAMEFGWSMEAKKKFGFDWVYFLVSFEDRDEKGHLHLQLYPEVIEALEEIGWKH